MSRGVALDRRKRYEIAHGTGAPVATTKGNVYIDDDAGDLWTRGEGGSWVLNGASGLWTRDANGILSPINTGDGLLVETTEGRNITLNATGTGSPGSNVNIVAAGDTAGGGVGGNISMTATNGLSNFSVTADGSVGGGGNIGFTATGGTGNFNVNAVGTIGNIVLGAYGGTGSVTINGQGTVGGVVINSAGTAATINMNTSGDDGSFNLSANGSVADYNISTSGSSSDVTFSLLGGNNDFTVTQGGAGGDNVSFNISGASSQGNFTVDRQNGGEGNITLSTKQVPSATDGVFTVNASRGYVNAPEGLLLTNTSDGGHADGVAFLKIPDIDRSWGSTWEVFHMYTELNDILIETVNEGACEADIYLDSCDHILGRAQSQIRLNGKEGCLISNGDGARGEGLIGDAWLKIPDSEDIWGNMVDGFKLVHLYNGDGDIKIETDSGACNGDIYIDSCDKIDMDAIGAIQMNSGINSNWNMNANTINEEKIIISASNGGAGTGKVEIVGSDNVDVISSNAGGTVLLSADNTATTITMDAAINISTATLTSSTNTTTLSASTFTITSGTINLDTGVLQIGGISGATGSGTNVTVVDGIVTAIS